MVFESVELEGIPWSSVVSGSDWKRIEATFGSVESESISLLTVVCGSDW